jgi:CRP-like cAMP-binding protein
VDKKCFGVIPREISVPELKNDKKLKVDVGWQARDERTGKMGAAHCHDEARTYCTTWERPDRVLDFRVTWVRTSPLFCGLSPAECSAITRAAREQRFARQQSIFQEDEPVRFVYLLASGSVKVTQLSQCGKEVILRLDRVGNLIGGLGDASSRVHTSTAHTMIACRVLAWEVAAFDTFVQRFPIIQRNATSIMTGRLKTLEERFCDVTTKRVPQRLARILLQLAGPNQACELESIGLSREELAQMTGTSLFTVSRLLSDWAERGIVQVNRKAVVVEQLPRLMQLAEDPAGPEPVRLCR